MPKKTDSKELAKQLKIERLQVAALGLIESMDRTILADSPEGVFRKSVSVLKINNSLSKIEKAETVIFDELPQVERAALLKAILREMLQEGEVLFRYKKFDELMHAKQKIMDLSSKGGQPLEQAQAVYDEKLQNILIGVSDINQEIALKLLALLNKTSSTAAISEMTSSNLAIVVGPNLYQIPPDKALDSSKFVILLTTELIEHASNIKKQQQQPEEKSESLLTDIFRRFKGTSTTTFHTSADSGAVTRGPIATFHTPLEQGGVTRVSESISTTHSAKDKLHGITGSETTEDDTNSDDDSLIDSP